VRGTLRDVTDPSGPITERSKHGDYGLPTVLAPDGITQRSESAFGNTRMFTGRMWDFESRLYQYRHRYMEPTFGRFVQRDPAEYRDGLNLYGYAISNPAGYLDSMGLCAQPSFRTLYEQNCPNGNELDCLMNTIGCSTWDLFEMPGIRDEAFQAERDVCGGNFRNDACDAFRHCYWSCLMAVEVGRRCARNVGNCHESCSNGSAAEIAMDLFNNARGRHFGAICEKKVGNKTERQCCMDKCRQAMNNGVLRWLAPSTSPGEPHDAL